MEKNWKEFVQEKYQEYKEIRHVECPAFGGERVYFNKYGFQHLIRKGKALREIGEQQRRLKLLRFAPLILGTARTITHFKEFTDNENNPAKFWSLEGDVEGNYIKVVVRSMGYGRKYFFSVMNKKLP